MRTVKIIFLALLISAAQISCFAPTQTYSKAPAPTVIAQIQPIVKRGQETPFFVFAVSGSVCHAGLGYYDLDSQWTTLTLPDTNANKDGRCEWILIVPEDAKYGVAEIRGYVETPGQEDRNLFPTSFCIENCP
jgi:hypothetical protein